MNLLACTKVFGSLLQSPPLQAMWLRKWRHGEELLIAASAGSRMLVKAITARGAAAGDSVYVNEMLNSVSYARSEVRYFHQGLELKNSISSDKFAVPQVCVGQFQGTALHIACALGRLGVAAELISAGADVNLHGEGFASPLQVAIQCKRLGVARILVSNPGIKVGRRWGLQ